MATAATNSMSNAANAFTPATGAITGKQETLSEWAGPYVTSMLGKAEALSNMPYEVYKGPLTAGASSLQQKLFDGLGGLAFPGRLGQSFTATDAPTLPTMTSSGMAGAPGAAAQPTGIAAQYMNPYLSAVLAPQLSELQRQAQIAQMNSGSKLSQAGAYGGSRQAIMDAELQRNLLAKANEAIGQGYASAYEKGLGQFNTEFGQAKDIANMMSGAGATQRDIESEGIKADLAAFESQRDFPYKQLQFQQSMLGGMPIQSTAASYQQPSSATNFLNTTGGLMDLYERIFGTSKTTTPPKAP
jgi:hypothetical protein